MIHREAHDTVTVLRMEHGKANALDTELLSRLSACLDELERSPDVRALVITGTGPIFSVGVDLFRILDADAAYTAEFVTSLSAGLRRFFASPLPIVAAINGHAIAGGCILAAACDHRIAAEKRGSLGLTELAVGVPFPAIGLEIAASLIPRHRLAPLIYAAETMPPARALELGLVDALAPSDEVLPRAIDAARRLGAIPPRTFALTKRLLRQPVLDRCDRGAEAFDADVLAVWQSDEARASIRAFMDRNVGKKKG